MHYEMEVEEHEVFPDDPEFDISKALEFSKEPRKCIRYECVPMCIIKHVYKIKTNTQDDKFYEGRTPESAFLNSSVSPVLRYSMQADRRSRLKTVPEILFLYILLIWLLPMRSL